jgi:hypothetical protein
VGVVTHFTQRPACSSNPEQRGRLSSRDGRSQEGNPAIAQPLGAGERRLPELPPNGASNIFFSTASGGPVNAQWKSPVLDARRLLR